MKAMHMRDDIPSPQNLHFSVYSEDTPRMFSELAPNRSNTQFTELSAHGTIIRGQSNMTLMDQNASLLQNRPIMPRSGTGNTLRREFSYGREQPFDPRKTYETNMGRSTIIDFAHTLRPGPVTRPTSYDIDDLEDENADLYVMESVSTLSKSATLELSRSHLFDPLDFCSSSDILDIEPISPGRITHQQYSTGRLTFNNIIREDIAPAEGTIFRERNGFGVGKGFQKVPSGKHGPSPFLRGDSFNLNTSSGQRGKGSNARFDEMVQRTASQREERQRRREIRNDFINRGTALGKGNTMMTTLGKTAKKGEPPQGEKVPSNMPCCFAA